MMARVGVGLVRVAVAEGFEPSKALALITVISQRRSNASANTPAGSANNIIGSVLAVCTNGTIVAVRVHGVDVDHAHHAQLGEQVDSRSSPLPCG